MRTDGRTDRRDYPNGRFSQFCEKRPKIQRYIPIMAHFEILSQRKLAASKERI
jgi:hypothetical protein